MPATTDAPAAWNRPIRGLHRTRGAIEEAAARVAARHCCHRQSVARDWCLGGDACSVRAGLLEELRDEWRAAATW